MFRIKITSKDNIKTLKNILINYFNDNIKNINSIFANIKIGDIICYDGTIQKFKICDEYVYSYTTDIKVIDLINTKCLIFKISEHCDFLKIVTLFEDYFNSKKIESDGWILMYHTRIMYSYIDGNIKPIESSLYNFIENINKVTDLYTFLRLIKINNLC